MPALHALQHEFGYIDHDAIPVLADVFNLSVAEVHGVISFYKDFRTTKPAGPIVQVCPACVSASGPESHVRAVAAAVCASAVEI